MENERGCRQADGARRLYDGIWRFLGLLAEGSAAAAPGHQVQAEVLWEF